MTCELLRISDQLAVTVMISRKRDEDTYSGIYKCASKVKRIIIFLRMNCTAHDRLMLSQRKIWYLSVQYNNMPVNVNKLCFIFLIILILSADVSISLGLTIFFIPYQTFHVVAQKNFAL